MRSFILAFLLPAALAAAGSPTASSEVVAEGAWKDRFDLAAAVHGSRILAAPRADPAVLDRLTRGEGWSFDTALGVREGTITIAFLEGAPPATIDTIVIELCAHDPSYWPREIEVLADGRPAGRFSFEKKGGHHRVTFPPVAASSVSLRLLSNHGGDRIGVGRVRVLEVASPSSPWAAAVSAAKVPPSAHLRTDLGAAVLGARIVEPRAQEGALTLLRGLTSESYWSGTTSENYSAPRAGTSIVIELARLRQVPRLDGILMNQCDTYSFAGNVRVLQVELSAEGADRGFVLARRFLIPVEKGTYHAGFPATAARFVKLTALATHDGSPECFGRVRLLESSAPPRASDEIAAAPITDVEPAGRHDLLSRAAGGRVVATEPELDAEDRRGAKNLVRIRDDRCGWAFGANPKNHAVLALAGADPVAVDTIAFSHVRDPEGVHPQLATPAGRARVVSVAWSLSATGPWTDLAPILLKAEPVRQASRVPPFKARFLKVSILDNGGGERFTLGRVQAYGPESPEALRPGSLLPFQNGGNLVRHSAGHRYLHDLVLEERDSSWRMSLPAGGGGDLVFAFRGWKVARLGALVVYPGKAIWLPRPARVDVLATTGEALSTYRSLGSLTITTSTEPRRLDLGGAPARHVKLRFHPPPGQPDVQLERLVLEEASGAALVFSGPAGEDAPEVQRSTPGQPLTEAEDNGAPERATPLTWVTTATGRIDRIEDLDVWSYVHDRPGKFQLTIQQDPFIRLEVDVRAPDGSTMARLLPHQLVESKGVVRLPDRPGRWTFRLSQPRSTLLMIFDTSGSIEPAIKEVKRAAADFLASASGREEVATALLPEAAHGALQLLGGFTTDLKSLMGPTMKGLEKPSSSDVVGGLEAGLEQLASRPGNRALVILSDFEPSTSDSLVKVWNAIERTGTRLYTIGFAIDLARQYQRESYINTQLDTMKNLARATGGRFLYGSSPEALTGLYGEVARALDEASNYSLAVGPLPGPGRLLARLQAPAVARRVKPARQLHVVLDCSGSMNERIGGERKIDIARRALTQLVDRLPDGAPIGLRIYGRVLSPKHPRTCEDTELLFPPGPLDRERMLSVIGGLTARGETPLIHTMLLAARDFAPGAERMLVALTDGLETCGGQEADLTPLASGGVDVIRVNVIGFGLGKPEEKAKLERLAAACRGSFFEARDAAALAAAIDQATSAPWEATAAGAVVARGTLSTPAVEVPPGSYRVRIDSTPPLEQEVGVEARRTTEVIVGIDPSGKAALLPSERR